MKMRRWYHSVLFMAILAGIAYAASSVQPAVGLYWTSTTDPTGGGGVSAPMWQILFRTDTQQLYVKTGAATTAWTPFSPSGATGITGTLTSGTIPKATGAQALGDSSVTDNGTTVSTGEIFNANQLQAVVSTNAAALTSSSYHNTGTSALDGKVTVGATIQVNSSQGTVKSPLIDSINGSPLSVLAYAIGSLAIDGTNDFIYTNADGTNTGWQTLVDSTHAFGGMFGTGIDGNVTIAAGTTTLARNMYYDTLTINNGGILDVHGFEVYVKTAVVCPASGTGTITFVTNNGGNGTNAAGGAGATQVVGTTGYLGGSCNVTCGVGGFGAGAGGTSPACSPNWPSYYSTGAAGQPGIGATGCAGTTAGGGPSTVTPITANNGGWDDPYAFAQQRGRLVPPTTTTMGGSCGGGGGGGGSCGGGGGGAGGGVVIVMARKWTNAANCAVTAPGGTGGNACVTSCSNSCGGGGGGAGGIVDVITGFGDEPGTISAVGGLGGTNVGGTGGGAACQGSSGRAMHLVMGMPK